MAIREIPPEQQEMETAAVLVNNCLSCIELCKTGTFLANRKLGRKSTNILDQKEDLAESVSIMLQKLGTVVTKLAPEKKPETRSRPLKESSIGKAAPKSYPFLRSLLRRKNRSKSENRKIDKSKKLSFRARTKSERIIEIDSRDEQLGEMCNLVQNMCRNISHLVTQCFVPLVPVFDENIISVFENAWAGVFTFDATFYAFQNRSKVDPIIPKGMSYPTESDVLCLIKKLIGMLDTLFKIVPGTEPEIIQNLTECNRYLRELHPILKIAFVENVDEV